MSTLVTTNGLQRIGVQASQATSGSGPTYSSARSIQVMSVDNASGAGGAFAAGHTTLNDVTPDPANEFDAAFDAASTRSSQTISHVMTLQTGDYNQIVNRIALHDDVAATVTASTATLVAGIDQLSLTKASTFTLKTTFQITQA